MDKHKVEIIFAIIWQILILVEVFRNYYIIEKLKKRPDYLISNVYRIITLGIVNIIYASITTSGIVSIEFVLFQMFSFGAEFDPLLNFLRKKPLVYVNTTNPSWFDRILGKLSYPALQMFFIGELMAATISFDIFIVKFGGFIDQMNGTYDWNNWIW